MTVSRRALFAGLFVAALLIAGVLSYYASAHPDGLNHVAQTTGFASTQKAHASDGSPLSGYSVAGVDDARLGKGLAGVIGVLVTLALFTALTWALRRRAARPDA